jgi:hypothetical protein
MDTRFYQYPLDESVYKSALKQLKKCDADMKAHGVPQDKATKDLLKLCERIYFDFIYNDDDADLTNE